MRVDWNKDEENESLGKGDLFGTPGISPRRFFCPKHGKISSKDIEWLGTKAYCPHCGKELEVEGS